MPKRVWQDRIVQNPRTFTVTNNSDGTVTLVPAPGIVSQVGTPSNAAFMNGIETDLTDNLLYAENVRGTIAVPTLNNGQVTRIDHKVGTTIIRSDVFTYATNLITEVRTIIATGDTITFKYHTDTIQVEVI